MQYSITFRHMESSEPLKEYGRDKLAKLEKFVDSVVEAEMILSVEKFRHKAEVLLTGDQLNIQAEEETDDMYSAIDAVVDKLQKQIKKLKGKQKNHKNGHRVPHQFEEETDDDLD